MIGLPLTSMPLLLLICLSHGKAFAGAAAEATLAAVTAQSVWCLSYAAVARRAGVIASVSASSACFGAVCLILYRLALPPVVAALLAAASVVVALAVWPEPDLDTPATADAKNPTDLGLRMLAGTTFNVGITGAASSLGARAAGLASAYPVLTVVLTFATHARQGSQAALQFLEGAMTGSMSVVTGLAVLAFMLPGFGPLAAW